MAKTTTTKAEGVSKAVMAKLKAKQKVLSRVRTKKAPSGYMKDEELVELFKLPAGKGLTVKSRLNKADLKEVEEQLVLELRFTVVEGQFKGTPLQVSFWLDLEDDEALEKAFENICFCLQKLGYETDELTVDDLPAIAAELTEDKPHVILYVKCYKRKAGKNKGKLGIGVNVNTTYDPEDSEDSEEEESEEDEEEEDDSSDDEDEEDDSEGEDEDEEEEEEKPSRGKAATQKKNSSSSKTNSKSTKKVEPEEEEEEEEEEEDDDFDESDPSTWDGYEAKVKPIGIKKAIKVTVGKYNKTKKTLVGEDSEGGSHTFTADQVIDWL